MNGDYKGSSGDRLLPSKIEALVGQKFIGKYPFRIF